MENLKETFMSSALRLATENMGTMNGGPFGAVVVRDGKIIATGVNSVLHAEAQAKKSIAERSRMGFRPNRSPSHPAIAAPTMHPRSAALPYQPST